MSLRSHKINSIIHLKCVGKTLTAAPLITDTFMLHPIKNTMKSITINAGFSVCSKTIPDIPDENRVVTENVLKLYKKMKYFSEFSNAYKTLIFVQLPLSPLTRWYMLLLELIQDRWH